MGDRPISFFKIACLLLISPARIVRDFLAHFALGHLTSDTTACSSFKVAAMHRLFHRQRPVWPNPEESTGSEFLDYQSKGMRCFETTGPVLELYQSKLLPTICKLLTDNQEEIERGETKHCCVGYGIYMVGNAPETSIPTIIIASLSVKK